MAKTRPGSEKPKRPGKDYARRAKLTIQRRTLVLMLLFGVGTFAALFARLYDLTITQHEDLQRRATEQQTQSSTISASRGSIYDRNGTILAISATADTVFLDPRAIQTRAAELDLAHAKALTDGLAEGETMPLTGEEYRQRIAERLSELLDLDPDDILAMMEKTYSQYEILKKRVDRDVGDAVRSFITEENIQGVHLQSDAKRYYPYSTLAAQVIGFLNSDNQGAYGLEALYEEELEGKTGLVVTARDGNGSEMLFQYEQLYDAQDGYSLETTIDSTIQYYLERGMEDMVSRFGAENGAAGVVLDPNSGAILAIASLPTYDVNEPREIYDEKLRSELAEIDGAVTESLASETGEESAETSGGASQEHSEAYYEKLGELQKLQWRSKAVNDTYEPGSTYKVLTLSMALEEGTADLNSTYYCSGSVKVSDYNIKCSNTNGHGSQTLTEAAGNSCNPAFISIAQSVGTERFYQYMKDFGLMSATGVDLQGEGVGVFAAEDDFTVLDLSTYAFGQNFTVTPIQLIAAQAACINGGYLYTPYVVEKVLDADGNVVSQHDATPVRQVISEETSETVRGILEYVVSDGTGRNGQVTGYRIGGKTGTADKRGTNDVVVSFLCFAPADDPQVIMLITMDTPSRNTGVYVSGGNMVAPTASSIMADILPHLGLAPSYTEEDASSAEGAVPYVSDGTMTLDAAAARLSEYGFDAYRTVGDGEFVTDQTPAGGAIVPASAEIILYMGEEKPDGLCTVPDVTGLSPSEANASLVRAGLIMKATGATGGSGVRVISQSHAAGEEVSAGTVVTVQMGQTGSTAD